MTGKTPTHQSAAQGAALAGAWRPLLQDLVREIRTPVRSAMARALARARARVLDDHGGDPVRLDEVTRAVGTGAGDITFAIDVVAEEAVERWFEAMAANGPLSLMTEDRGWRHLGPAETGGADATVELDGFDHGGPRIALDPIDGTRNVMHDLRSAWVVVSFAGPGPTEPRYGDLTYGLVSEIPDSRGAEVRELDAILGAGARLRRLKFDPDSTTGEQQLALDPIRSDTEPRLDRGYFPFFGFHPSCRADVEALGYDVFRHLKKAHPELDLSTVFNDQYISSGGQLALLVLGTYRAIIDPRETLGLRTANPTQTAKPYDMAGAALVAQEAGCVVTDPQGRPLDFPIDTHTPVDFAGFHNAPTASAIQPHLSAALERVGTPSR